MDIAKDIEKKILDNNLKITELLQENENLLRGEGYKPPTNNYGVDYVERIHIPKGYIRTSVDFFERYHLSNIVKEYNTRNNISYSLQLSDYYNFLLNRFYVWGSIRTMLYKQDIINLVSIFEALITEASVNIFGCCNDCKKICKCQMRLTTNDQRNMKKSVEKLCSMEILDFDEKEIERIKQIYDLRNRVHIRLATKNEFLDNSFSKETHNELIGLLVRAVERLNSFAVPKYNRCENFTAKDS